jgi:hypothetical protein
MLSLLLLDLDRERHRVLRVGVLRLPKAVHSG